MKMNFTQENDEVIWQNTREINTVYRYNLYLEKMPLGNYRKEAQQCILDLEQIQLQEEEKLWQEMTEKNDYYAYSRYKNSFPNGKYIEIAEEKIETLKPADLKASEEETVLDNNGPHNMLVGGIWCVGGIIVTAVTYSMVSESGGTYFVAYGAIIYGGYQFVKGLFQTIFR